MKLLYRPDRRSRIVFPTFTLAFFLLTFATAVILPRLGDDNTVKLRAASIYRQLVRYIHDYSAELRFDGEDYYPTHDYVHPLFMSRVYADVNQRMPRSYWDYDAVNIQWGSLESYEVVRKIGNSHRRGPASRIADA